MNDGKSVKDIVGVHYVNTVQVNVGGSVRDNVWSNVLANVRGSVTETVRDVRVNVWNELAEESRG